MKTLAPTRLSTVALLLVVVVIGCGAAVADPPAATAPRGPATVVETPQPAAPFALTMPNKADSLKFAVLGDFGTGSREQYDLAAVMKRVHDQYPYELVILVGDNLYGSERPQDFKKKFEDPYKPLLDDGVKFYASLGNHDAREQRYYKLFNMDGKLYYSFKPDKQSVRFFALESSYPTPEQIAWFEKELQSSNSDWKIPYFHHPPYSSGDRHGSDTRLREVLEPLFLKYGVSVVFTGHDHFYERLKPQKGIVYFVAGSGGQLRKGNIDKGSGLTAAGNDQDQAFMICEINGDQLWFDAISRAGKVFDSGVITRRK
jgi:predicted MPP superfamily phosphohydrolase